MDFQSQSTKWLLQRQLAIPLQVSEQLCPDYGRSDGNLALQSRYIAVVGVIADKRFDQLGEAWPTNQSWTPVDRVL